MPFDQLDDFITPAELFYIRSHFATPELDPISYRLSIGGAVRSKLKLSYADIRTLPSRTRVATLECAGNGRVFANTLPLAETRCDEPEIAAECFYGFQGCTDYSAGNLRLAGILCRHEDARRSLLMQNRSNALSENKPEFRRPTCEAKSLLDIAARSLRPNRVRGFREAQMRVTIGKD